MYAAGASAAAERRIRDMHRTIDEFLGRGD